MKNIFLLFVIIFYSCIALAYDDVIIYELKPLKDSLKDSDAFNPIYINNHNEVCGTWNNSFQRGYFVYSPDLGMKKIESNGQICGFNSRREILGIYGSNKEVFLWDPLQGFRNLNDHIYGSIASPWCLYENGWALLEVPAIGARSTSTSLLWNGRETIYFDSSHLIWNMIENKGFSIHQLTMHHYVDEENYSGNFFPLKFNRVLGEYVPSTQRQFIVFNGQLYIEPFEVNGELFLSENGELYCHKGINKFTGEIQSIDKRQTMILDSNYDIKAQVSRFWGHKRIKDNLVYGYTWNEKDNSLEAIWNIDTGEVIDIRSCIVPPLAQPYDVNADWEKITISKINDFGVFTGIGYIFNRFYPLIGFPVK